METKPKELQALRLLRTRTRRAIGGRGGDDKRAASSNGRGPE